MEASSTSRPRGWVLDAPRSPALFPRGGMVRGWGVGVSGGGCESPPPPCSSACSVFLPLSTQGSCAGRRVAARAGSTHSPAAARTVSESWRLGAVGAAATYWCGSAVRSAPSGSGRRRSSAGTGGSPRGSATSTSRRLAASRRGDATPPGSRSTSRGSSGRRCGPSSGGSWGRRTRSRSRSVAAAGASRPRSLQVGEALVGVVEQPPRHSPPDEGADQGTDRPSDPGGLSASHRS
jgi:hypothetical protein